MTQEDVTMQYTGVEGMMDGSSDIYLHFYRQVLDAELTKREAGKLCERISVRPGMKILDLGCGHGRMSNHLAAMGAVVTGVDFSETAIGLAQESARPPQFAATYVRGDMRELDSIVDCQTFDAVLLWHATFGLFSDVENARMLALCKNALKLGGSLVIDHLNKAHYIRRDQPFYDVLKTQTGLLVNQYTYNLHTERLSTKRMSVIEGDHHAGAFSVRLYGAQEIASLLQNSGFADINIRDIDENELTLDSTRMLVSARRSS